MLLSLIFPGAAWAQDKLYLYVLHAQEGHLVHPSPNSSGLLVMKQVDKSVAFFSYKQDQDATIIPIKDFINFWSSGETFFTAPPTGIVVAYSQKGEYFTRSAGRLSHPRYNILEKKLTFEVMWFDAKQPEVPVNEISLLIETPVMMNHEDI